MLEELLEKRGLKYEDLNPEEKETYNALAEQVSKTRLTLDSLKESISRMRESVETALIDEPEYIFVWIIRKPNPKNIYLKARLKNYLLIESLLIAPERAKAMLERMIGAMVDTKEQ